MVQTFNPDTVMLSQSGGQEIRNAGFTAEFLQNLVAQSKTLQLGSPVQMESRMKRVQSAGELTDAYFVGEGEKIGTAKVGLNDYILEARKIAVILPVTEEFLSYTWAQYFREVLPAVVDKFNKKIDGAVFLGLHNNPFGANVLASATASGNVIEGDLNFDNLLDLEATTDAEPTAIVGHRSVKVALRGIADVHGNYAYDRNANTIDGIPFHELKLVEGQTYPAGTVLAGDFRNGLKYGVPNGTDLRIKIADQATLSKVQNTDPDTGDVHLFEQDMQAARFVFEIAVAIPNPDAFAAIEPDAGV